MHYNQLISRLYNYSQISYIDWKGGIKHANITRKNFCRSSGGLPNESKAILVEKLVANIEDNIDPQITKSHLTTIKKRRDEIRAGKVTPINGEEGLAQVRKIIEK